MEETEHSLNDRVEALLDDFSMPEVVAALVLLSRDYAAQLRREGNREYLGWEPWERALAAAIREVAGPEELHELLSSS